MMEAVHLHRRPPKSDSSDNVNNSTFESNSVMQKTIDLWQFFRFKDELMMCIAIPFIILLIFGGKLSLLIVCFGGLIGYIFDLLGTIEGTLISFTITVMILFSSLVWAARNILIESIYNFSLVILMGIILFYTLVIVVGHFNSVVNELGMLFMITELLLFATIPIISSSFIAWFLCVEVPSFDLEICFVCCYFAYVFYLGKPRYVSFRNVREQASTHSTPVIMIPFNVLMVMYSIPIIISPIIHVTVHHNVLSTSLTRLIGYSFSILFPSSLMIFCARKQIYVYFSVEYKWKIQQILSILQYFVVGALVFILQFHPILDELKSFSALHEPYPTRILILSSFLIAFAFLLYKEFKLSSITSNNNITENDDISYYNNKSKISLSQYTSPILQLIVSSLISISITLISVIVNIPYKVLLFSSIGAFCVSEYHLRPVLSTIMSICYIIIGTFSMRIIAISFTMNTIYHLQYSFVWLYYSFNTRLFSILFSYLLSFAIAVPALIPKNKQNSNNNSLDSILPNSSFTKNDNHNNKVSNTINSSLFTTIFGFFLTILNIVFVSSELMIREQNWSSLDVTVDEIYPVYYLIGSTFLLTLTAIGLFAMNKLG
eukprot:gene4662-6550_t